MTKKPGQNAVDVARAARDRLDNLRNTVVPADVEVTGLFALAASSLLLLPPLAWIGTAGGIREPIERLENWLQHRAEPLVGILAIVFAAYLFYEGLHGLGVLSGT